MINQETKKDAIGALNKAIKKYNGSWEKRLSKQLDKYKEN